MLNSVRVYDLQLGDPQTVMWFMLYTQVLQADGASYRNILLTHQQGTLMPDPPPILLQKTAELKLTPSGAPAVAVSSPVATKEATNGIHSVNREPRGSTTFSQKQIEGLLAMLSLPLNSPLSVLAVELLPGPFHLQTFRKENNQALQEVARAAGRITRTVPGDVQVNDTEDPLGISSSPIRDGACRSALQQRLDLFPVLAPG